MPYVPSAVWNETLEKIEWLEGKVAEHSKENAELRQRVKELEAENKKFRKLLEEKGSCKAVPHFIKEDVKHRHKKPGRKQGHKGTTRTLPENPDKRKKLRLKRCPCCNAKVKKLKTKPRKRVVWDVIPGKAESTEYEEPAYYCNNCDKVVYPKPGSAPANSAFGYTLMLLVVFMKVGLSLTYNKTQKLLLIAYGLQISQGTLANTVNKAAELFKDNYDDLVEEMKQLKKLHVDETGWRINGKNNWLWAFIADTTAVYKIANSRGHEVVLEVLGPEFKGILASDFWSAYNKLPYKKQKCLIHLLRELSKTLKKNKNEEYAAFNKKLKRLIKDSIRFTSKRTNKDKRLKAKNRFEKRLRKLLSQPFEDDDCKRHVKTLTRHAKELFLFVTEKIPYHNNAAERGIRPNVVTRKISGGNRSQRGAESHAILSSIIQTSLLRNQNFLQHGYESLTHPETGFKT